MIAVDSCFAMRAPGEEIPDRAARHAAPSSRSRPWTGHLQGTDHRESGTIPVSSRRRSWRPPLRGNCGCQVTAPRRPPGAVRRDPGGPSTRAVPGRVSMTRCRTRNPERSWAPTASRARSARARWARCSAASTPGSTAGSRSRSCPRSTATAPSCAPRFVREGRAVAAISHPNVVQVFATGTFDERPYIAMELLDGTDLGSTVEKQRPARLADRGARDPRRRAGPRRRLEGRPDPSRRQAVEPGAAVERRGQGHRLRPREAGRSGQPSPR